MNHEREQSHARSTTGNAAAHDDAAAAGEPGQTSRSALLRKRDDAVASGLVQRKARDANGVADGAERAVAAASSSSGSPLPATLMRKFESSLGADLSGVRVHTGDASAHAADAVGAKAYTMGNDIHFGAGHYDPSSPGGQHLLAHEVAHTVQQSGSAKRIQRKLKVTSARDEHEHEADRAADAMVAGGTATVSGAFGLSRHGLQRSSNFGWEEAASQLAESASHLTEKAKVPLTSHPGEGAAKTKGIAPTITFKGSIDPGDIILLPADFGRTGSFTDFVNRVVTPIKDKFKVKATCRTKTNWDTRKGIGPRNQKHIADENSPELSANNYMIAVSDLTPDSNGKPPCTQFWAQDLVAIHEKFHAKAHQKAAKAGLAEAVMWLKQQTASTEAEVNERLADARKKIVSVIGSKTGTRTHEIETLKDGADKYRARAKAIKNKGDKKKYK